MMVAPAVLAGLARKVLRVRFGQMMVNEALKRKEFRIPVHLALGHEAVAVAVDAVMGPDDALCLTHRNIHYNLARAGSIRDELAELRLDATGVAGGWLGSMNMSNPSCGIVYTSSILGNNLCVATGVALGSRIKGLGAATFVVTGDGAMEEGVFFETLQVLRSFELAAVVLVENNEWSLATRTDERRCPIALDRLADAFGIHFERLSGNDVFHYTDRLAALRQMALDRAGPVIVEVALSTLGDWRQVQPGYPEGKFINYHHGAAPTVELSEWPLIADDPCDPVHVLAQRLGSQDVRALARSVFGCLEDEIR